MNTNELYVVTTIEELTTKYNTNFSYYCLFNLLCLKKQSNTFAAELQANKTCFNTFDTTNLLDDAAKIAPRLIIDKRTLIKQLGLLRTRHMKIKLPILLLLYLYQLLKRSLTHLLTAKLRLCCGT